MKPDSDTEQAVRACLNAFLDAYASRRVDDAMACVVPDGDLVAFGTGADEKRIGPAGLRAQMDRDWSQCESASYAVDWSSVSAAGSVAWMSTDGAFRIRAGGQDMTLPARASFVFERRAGRWLIAHAHFSTPAAAQAPGQSF